MDLELLRTFLEVARTRHFGESADALSLTQAAVSARIKNLESVLGVSLFDRSKREVRLTPEGHRLVRHADLLIAEWRKARQDVAAGGADAQLSVGGSLRLWDVLLQDWLHRLRRARPMLALSAESHTPEVLTRRLLDGLLEVAFMLEPPQIELLQVTEVATLELMLVSSEPGLDCERVLADGYVMVDWGLAHAVQHRRLFPNAPEPKTRVGQAKMALAYLLEVGGAAYLPARIVEADVAARRLHWVDDAPRIWRRAHAVYPLRSAKADLIGEALAVF